MPQLSLKVSSEQLAGIRLVADRRHTHVSWLLRDYIDYLLQGGKPVTVGASELPTGEELAALAAFGGAFDWLREEPDIYTLEDGEPI